MNKKEVKRIYDIVRSNEHIKSGNDLSKHLGIDTREASHIMSTYSHIRSTVARNRSRGNTALFNWAMSLMRPTGQSC